MIVIQRMTLIQMMKKGRMKWMRMTTKIWRRKKRGALSNNAEALALRDDPEVI